MGQRTDRGPVLTLGDVRFETDRAELGSRTPDALAGLIALLEEKPDRTVLVDGHTDEVGTGACNQLLSPHRADAVRDSLIRSGMDAGRLS